ncbi:MAG: AAA family ATPase [Bacteroidales bacterium]
MKILAIRGCNIASLEGPFEIDFTQEPLVSSGIYAITGPTGAGKSTILDALSLALYENTPRLTKAGENKIPDVKTALVGVNNPVTLMRRGATEAYAEVDFIGIDGIAYRSRWSVRRGHRKAHNPIQAPSVILTRIDNNAEFPEKKKGTLAEISRLVGLTYDQFTRTVLLAQGDFALFLKANDSDRASLLEKLTGTSIYTQISMRIYARTEEVRKELENLRTRMGDNHLLSDEEIEKYNKELNELDIQLRSVEKEYQDAQHMQTWFLDEEKFKQQISLSLQKLSDENQEKEQEAKNYNLLQEIALTSEGFSFLKDKRELYNRLSVLTNQIEELQTQIAYQKEQSSAQEQLFEKAENDLKTFELQEETYNQQMQKANTSESKLKDAEYSFNEEYKLLEASQKRKQDKLQQIEKYQKQYQQSDNNRKLSADWLAKYEERKEVAENHTLILHHLKQAETYLDKINTLSIQEKTEVSTFDDLKKAFFENQKLEENSRKSYADVQGKKLQKKQELDKTNLQSVKDSLEKENIHCTYLQNLIRIWELTLPLKKEFENNVSGLKTLEPELRESQNKLSESEKTLLVLQGKFEIAEQVYNRTLQAANENVAAMRATLQENEPCPVCGSTHHPYHSLVDQHFRQLLKEAKDSFDQLKETKEQLNDTVANLRIKISVNNEKIASLIRRNEELRQNLAQLQEQWNENILSSRFSTEVVGAKEDMLVEALNQSNACIAQYDKEIALIETLKKEVEELEKEESLKELRLVELQHKLATQQERLSASENKINSIRTQIEEQNILLDKDLSAVDGYFRSADWRMNWKQDVAKFLTAIQEFTNSWNENQKQLELSHNQMQQFQSNIEIEEQTLKSLSEEYQRLEQSCGQKQQNITAIKKELFQLLGGKSIQELEKAHTNEKENLTKCKELINQKWNTIKESLAKLSGELQAVEKQQKEHTAQLTQATLSFDEWLQGLNNTNNTSYTETRISELMAIPAEWIKEKEAIHARMERAILEIKAELKTHQQNLEDHNTKKPADFTLQDALNIMNEKKQVKENIDQQRIHIKSMLNQNTERMHLLTGLQALFEAKRSEYDNWSKLNAEIGKADGGKFKHIAQSYTLDLLLQTANMHIRTIAPRYRLQRIPESLSLLVVDRDMCDQIRSVHSLSGGETFLVSLSLALGLSSLSSKQMNIESLFIDEGFGSLDEESLMMAMDALESLRLQGRKVGVITHVKEMTERITTRIQVVKQQNGASKIMLAQ